MPRLGELGLPWLLTLRWVALVAQLVLVLVAHYALGAALPLVPLIALVAAGAISNAALALFGSRFSEPARLIGPTLLLDTLLLTAILHQSGGPSNPFAVIYLVYVTLAAVGASGRWTWALVVVSMLAYGSLFFAHEPLPAELGGHDMHATHHGGHAMHGMHDDAGGFSAHLQGMWLAFSLAAMLIAWFVTRLARALAEERERATRAARLASLTTLAAGAAHELATPLGTIKMVARELERGLASAEGVAAELREDARLVRLETDRCRAILDRLAAGSGELAGEGPEDVSLRALFDEVRAGLSEEDAARVAIEGAEGSLRAPRRALVQALGSLARNALDAGPGEIVMRATAEERGVRFEVIDRGEGMSADVLARAGEPFFTTRAAGRGMGLGIFLARAVAEQLGGGLSIVSSPGRGTEVRLTIART